MAEYRTADTQLAGRILGASWAHPGRIKLTRCFERGLHLLGVDDTLGREAAAVRDAVMS